MKRSYAICIKLSLFFGVTLGAYVGSYLLFTTVYYGAFEGERMRIRLFPNSYTADMWWPLLRMEQAVRRGEFYGQVKSGASLPPLDPKVKRNQ